MTRTAAATALLFCLLGSTLSKGNALQSASHRKSSSHFRALRNPALAETNDRRDVLRSGISSTVAALVFGSFLCTDSAEAVNNPLNLKGSYWETGKLYRKEDNVPPDDPAEILAEFAATATALDSLEGVAEEGRFGDLSRLLRGGAVSESRLRLGGYALVDAIEDDDRSYFAGELLRGFLRDFAYLDAASEAAARRAKIDGGITETMGLAVVSPFGAANELARVSNEPALGKDARIAVLIAIGRAATSLRAFNKAAADSLNIH
eukprot:CAMPEP_0183308620 /NCGR_PEP_ID=MMETSP0160_2-20130417/22361_1 /TAXON_ID=2839 ORGANISM="Odontella Sinensis, Strain Grunow 1884" /NCGR_SAMPLE_ID=MMETSP0160_2 /ASSEMBLY_ACC=CAM_ASM_000250 /LENGTH=262 /DNA_ID=CAMNT_0025472481 /DNA_START=36 /DNA_END=824 /DNA_ORIENTATION=-